MIGLAVTILISTTQPRGAIDPNVTVQQVCVPGYSKTVRPSAALTDKLKAYAVKTLGLPHPPKYYEGDHADAIENGGCPSPKRCPDTFKDNFWLQPWMPPPGAHQKDEVENYVHKLLCAGAIDFEKARDMQYNWRQVYDGLHAKAQ